LDDGGRDEEEGGACVGDGVVAEGDEHGGCC
jgi:hypothetical protein